MALSYATCLALWQRAANAEFGIIITINPNDRGVLRQDLYKTKQKAKDLEIDKIQMAMPRETEIWLVKRAVEL